MEPPPRKIPDVANHLEWNLVLRQNFQAQEVGDGTYRPIEPRIVRINDSYLVAVGIHTEIAPAHWYTGGWVSQQLAMGLSSTSIFPTWIRSARYRIPRGIMTLCPFPAHQSSWFLQIDFAHWFKQVELEVWRYDGRDFDTFTAGSIQAVPNTIPQTSAAVVLMDVDPLRQGAIIMNEGDAPLAIEFDTAPTMASNLVILQPGGYFEVPYGFKGQIQGVWASAGSGFAKIREFR